MGSYLNFQDLLNQYTTAHGGSVGNGANHEISSYQGVSYTYLNDTHLAQAIYSDISGPHLYKLGYDALGRCVKRTTGANSVIYYIYDGERPIFEFDPTGGTPSINVYGRGIDEIIARSNNGDGQYPMQDHEGSVIVVTGGGGSIREWYRYDAFGAPISIKNGSNNSFTVTQINNRFLFTGREYAPQFGFYEYRARAYHPGIGRFMSEDPNLFVRRAGLDKPMADPADADAPEGAGSDKMKKEWTFFQHPDEAEINLFRYCYNDPINKIDPEGLHDVNVFPQYEDIRNYADAAKLDKFVFTIAGHGVPGGMIDSRKNELPATKLAALVRENPKFKEGMEVRLDACSTGADPGDGSLPYAKQLANALNSPVRAPTTDGQMDYRGKMTLERKGEYKLFRPDKKAPQLDKKTTLSDQKAPLLPGQ